MAGKEERLYHMHPICYIQGKHINREFCIEDMKKSIQYKEEVSYADSSTEE